MSDSARGSLLVVGGSPSERERWVRTLSDLSSVSDVADASTGLERLSPSVEVLLVHRDLPDREPSAFLSAVRERGYAVRAALLTPVAPTENIVDRGFDAWLGTPVEEARLRRAVESLFACRAYDRAVADLYRLARRRGTDRRSVSPEEVEGAREAADEALAAIDTADREALLANSPSAFGPDTAEGPDDGPADGGTAGVE